MHRPCMSGLAVSGPCRWRFAFGPLGRGSANSRPIITRNRSRHREHRGRARQRASLTEAGVFSLCFSVCGFQPRIQQYLPEQPAPGRRIRRPTDSLPGARVSNGILGCRLRKLQISTYPLHSSSPGRDIGRGVSTPPGRQTSIGRVRAAMFDRKSLGEIDRIAGILPSNDPRHPCGFVTRHVGVHH